MLRKVQTMHGPRYVNVADIRSIAPSDSRVGHTVIRFRDGQEMTVVGHMDDIAGELTAPLP